MNNQRQQTFQQLRSPCVELSAIALKFKAQQASIKQVLSALNLVRDVLSSLGEQNLLDEKLAEYAFFPLTHIFNETRRLSSTCLETAVNCTSILVAKGWRQNITPDMGKQLLILISFIAGGHPQGQSEPPSDDLKIAAFHCIGQILVQLTLGSKSEHILNDGAFKSTIDQLVYMLLESVTDSQSEEVQKGAADTLLKLIVRIPDPVMLASLLPRTTSSLTKALRPSTQIRKSRKVLELDLRLLTTMLRAVLADDLLFSHQDPSSDQATTIASRPDGLDEAWLRATAPQVKNALTQVTKLQTHDSSDVKIALAGLCLMIIEDCPKSLSDSLPLMVDTLTVMAQNDKSGHTLARLRHVVFSKPEIADLLRFRLYDWLQTLPRIMQNIDDRPKEVTLHQIASAINLSMETFPLDSEFIMDLATKLLATLTPEVASSVQKPHFIESANVEVLPALENKEVANILFFPPVLLNSPSQKELSQHYVQLLRVLKENGLANRIARSFVDRIPDTSPEEQLAAAWLSLTCLRMNNGQEFNLDGILEFDSVSDDLQLSKPFLISDLYANMVPFLIQDSSDDSTSDWRMKAIALECTVLQAEQLGVSYRPELLDTLYPIVSFLGSSNELLKDHVVVALNKLAIACKYSSTSDMLIENVDYLVNAVGMKLNAFDVSPQAPRVLLMMVRLCGAQVIPYLDDLVGSIFGAVDNFHGYPPLVELLFQVLSTIVDESRNQARLAIQGAIATPDHRLQTDRPTRFKDIFDDVQKRKTKKRKLEEEDEVIQRTPTQPSRSRVKEDDGITEPEESVEDGKDTDDATVDMDEKKVLSKTHHLLLNIAQATSPHLTSPSPQVRHVLLEILEQVSPLLAEDENTFLPLINAVWPSLVPRLLAQVDHNDESELSYNVCAAADTVAVLCKGAGSFMSSRIENLLPGLVKLFNETKARLVLSTPKQTNQRSMNWQLGPVWNGTRSGAAQILQSVIRLLCTILSYVRLKDDDGDKIFSLLVPFSGSSEVQGVTEVLEDYNSDELWLWRTFMKRDDEARELFVEAA